MLDNLHDREKFYGQADFRLFVPYKPGQRVFILGDAIELADSLAGWDVEPTLISSKLKHIFIERDYEILEEQWPLSLNEHSCDHAFVPEIQLSFPDRWLDDIDSILKPEGWLFVGVENSKSIDQFIKNRLKRHGEFVTDEGGLKNSASLSLTEGKQLLSAHGFIVKHIFGVASNLKKPGVYIPLEHPEIIQNFYVTMYSPFSWKDRIMYWLGLIFIKVRLQQMLFSHFFFTAQLSANLEKDCDQ